MQELYLHRLEPSDLRNLSRSFLFLFFFLINYYLHSYGHSLETNSLLLDIAARSSDEAAEDKMVRDGSNEYM